jgi:hypothetical protein
MSYMYDYPDLGSVHLRSKWTLIRSVHFARMALIYKDVETVITERLLKEQRQMKKRPAHLLCYSRTSGR